jgi:hypothetical protein
MGGRSFSVIGAKRFIFAIVGLERQSDAKRILDCPLYQPGVRAGLLPKRSRKDNGRIGTEENRGFGIETLGATARIISNQGYAKFRSRSHDAVICVYDSADNVIATHQHKGDFKECS